MRQAFQSYTPRVRPMRYDSLEATLGCQPITGTSFGSFQAFHEYCAAEHDDSTTSRFNSPATVSYTMGPNVVGGPLPFRTEWAFWASTAGVRYGKFSLITPPAATTGATAPYYAATPGITSLTAAFDVRGNPAIAIQKTTSTIEIKYNDGTDDQTVTFSGNNPLLGLIRIVSGDETVSSGMGLIIFYLKEQNDVSLFARVESESFGTEHNIHSLLPFELTRLIQVDYHGNELRILAIDDRGADVTLHSAYTINTEEDFVDLGVDITSGYYFESGVEASPNQEDFATLDVDITEGLYFDAVVSPSPQPAADSATLSVAITGGSYENES